MRRPGKKTTNKLLTQIFISAAILGVMFIAQRGNIPVAQEAAAVFQNQFEKDYTISQIVSESAALGKTVLEKPAQIYARLREQTDTDHFILPTDEMLEFVSEEEIQVYAANSGVISEIVFDENTSVFTVSISHDNQIITKYAGLTEVYVKELQKVKKGDIIASVANPSGSAANKLSFEIWENGKKTDPSAYME